MKIRDAIRTVDEQALRNRVERLRRNELDFDARLAARLQAVADPDMPTSDPLYQRLLHARSGLTLQRAEAERELARRAKPGAAFPDRKRCDAKGRPSVPRPSPPPS